MFSSSCCVVGFSISVHAVNCRKRLIFRITNLLYVELDVKLGLLIHCLGSSGCVNVDSLVFWQHRLFTRSLVWVLSLSLLVYYVFLLLQVKWYCGKTFPDYFQHCLEVKREYYQNCWVVWHNVHSQQHTHMSSSYRSSRLGLSHWDPYAVHRGGSLELYYCNMVEWCWWDSSLIWKTSWFPSVLWHCRFGHMTCKNRPRNDL